MNKKNIVLIWILLLILSAAGWKAWLVWRDVIPFNADEAVVGLMARHILAGERPIFFYGQAYMGSLDAFLVAAGFAVFGTQVWVIRLVQGMLYLGTIITTLLLGRIALDNLESGVLAAALLVVPTVNVTLYTTASLGGYGEALLLGNLILICGVVLYARLGKADGKGQSAGWFAGLGLLSGLGLWANALTLVYTAPVGIVLIVRLAQTHHLRSLRWNLAFLLLGLAGGLAGALPWLVYATRLGLTNLVGELTGSAVAVEPGSWLVRSGRHLLYLVLMGSTVTIGLRPPWEMRWLAMPLLPLALFFWLAVLVFVTRRFLKPRSTLSIYWLLGGVGLTLSAGFIFTSFGVDPTGRYFLPLTVPLALGAAGMLQQIKNRKIAWGLVAMVLFFQGWGTLQCAQRFPPGLTTQFDLSTAVDHREDAALIDFLTKQGEMRGYTTYWVAYPLAFRSDERLIFTPRLPYHADLRYTPRDNRYAPYEQMVESSTSTAYITARNPVLDEALRREFTRLKVDWAEKPIGEYRVYYRLSRAVRPDELTLKEDLP